MTRPLGDPSIVFITGASSGLGAALAATYAKAGRTLVLHGRDAGRLEAVARACTDRGASVRSLVCDVRELGTLVPALEVLARELPIDLAILNAGDASTRQEGAESWEDIDRLIDVNLRATLAAAQVLVAAMRARGSGQIAFISSLSAYHGMPLSPAYCATKSALKAYGESLRAWLSTEGVAVNVVLPGFVDTPMSRRFPGPKPFLVSADAAAATIQRGLARNQARIAFPFPLSWGAWWLAVLPAAWAQALLRRIGY